MGLCLHDFAIEPCPYHLNCVRGCPDYLRRKGDVQERQYLLQLEAQTERVLEAVRQQGQAQSLAPAWIQHYEVTLLGIRRALAVDEMEDTDVELVAPNSVAMERHNGKEE